MKVLFDKMALAVKGAVDKSGNVIYVPTVKELCQMDRRLIYVGDITTKYGEDLHDAFLHVLNPTEVFTVEKYRKGVNNLLVFYLKESYVSKDSPVLQTLYEKYRDKEIFVGDVCDGTGRTGEVWHKTYKYGFYSTTLYTKDRDSENRIRYNIVNPPLDGCFSIPDRFGCRVLVKTPNEPDKHYSFFSGSSAVYQWGRLKACAKEGQLVLHSLDPDYHAYFVHRDSGEFDDYPELVEAYSKCYSNKGYLKVK